MSNKFNFTKRIEMADVLKRWLLKTMLDNAPSVGSILKWA